MNEEMTSPALKKMFDAIENADLGHYRFEIIEAFAIVERAKNDPFTSAILAFRYGFIKGTRSEKARQKALNKRKEAHT